MTNQNHMKKKHYIQIAEIIRLNNNCEGYLVLDSFLEQLSNYFDQDNPDFNREKFLKACGVEK